jgi:hypothetical protein
MTWLERVRQKNFVPHTRSTDKTDESLESDDHKKLLPYESGTDKTDKSPGEETFVSFGSAGGEGYAFFIEPVQVIVVAYQRFSLDYDLPDGTYTPKQLRQAKLLVKPGMVLRYRLQWPGGVTQPPHQPIAIGDRLRPLRMYLPARSVRKKA